MAGQLVGNIRTEKQRNFPDYCAPGFKLFRCSDVPPNLQSDCRISSILMRKEIGLIMVAACT